MKKVKIVTPCDTTVTTPPAVRVLNAICAVEEVVMSTRGPAPGGDCDPCHVCYTSFGTNLDQLCNTPSVTKCYQVERERLLIAF